jgi:hypothetical protein
MVPVDLPVGRFLENRNRPIEYVYFIESGFASVVATGFGAVLSVTVIFYTLYDSLR